jgi:hypothetical protein
LDEVFGDVNPGTLFSGFFTFDPTALDGAPGDPSTGSYSATGSPYNFSIDIGGHTFSTSDLVNVAVLNSNVDQYSALGLTNGLELSILLQDNTGSIFSSDALPTVPPSLSTFTLKDFHLVAALDSGQVQYDGVIDSFNAVPEPSSLLLVVSGAAFVLIARRGQTHTTKSSSSQKRGDNE